MPSSQRISGFSRTCDYPTRAERYKSFPSCMFRSAQRRHPMRRFLLTIVAVAMLAPASAAPLESEYFELPRGDYPHDVAIAPDGTAWYSGQRLGIAGRLHPETGAITRIPLGKNSAPHGVIIGPDGAPWFTDGGQNAIVRVDPETSDVKVWLLPPERAPYVNLNTAAFDG